MEYLTKVHLQFEEKKRNSKLIFGTPEVTENISFNEHASRKIVYFKPDSLFALELWAANEYGTAFWMIYVLRTVWPGERANEIPLVKPGAEILLEARGKVRVSKVLKWLRQLKQTEENLSSLSPDYFRAAHYNLKNNLVPRKPLEPYGPVLDFLKNKKT